ncbi:unnamed protein product [marine sediment metagenome]|uniref:Uncharacterized protein n=1 Tax=marine sediment metagenome TaxID=412755 RepID=X1GCK0_9ZZZZ
MYLMKKEDVKIIESLDYDFYLNFFKEIKETYIPKDPPKYPSGKTEFLETIFKIEEDED